MGCEWKKGSNQKMNDVAAKFDSYQRNVTHSLLTFASGVHQGHDGADIILISKQIC